ncbi:proline iminopeptidase-family hydrolase [Flavobacterium capsici]|uniref:Proline iminopeptidase-family hydrolase n=1 Tax=Flavobacterium capsici TaxID=3075618 RepID=A0AA96F0V5_9FLAO|nr:MULTISPECIES: proline iminopeptidase-family hydrolase [unclassified Flavobacterium]WNM18022.1 proline iminopeptidase-family hydrolase [Flavobacterium sp. PMR2A8]WNM22074.1 proline iminopeptidase-family hydrolase [Flavobacterium sp. PMTSA4]
MKLNITYFLFVLSLFFLSCGDNSKKEIATENNSDSVKENYLSFANRDDQKTGGIKMIPIETPVGKFNVWTKTVGNNPTIKILLLHGGPGGTHEFFENFDGYFPQESIEYIYYDQLGSYYSDQPTDKKLWTIDRFVEEVEQVRKALKLDNTNFYLLGQSWGGILAMEYAFKYQQNLKGLIISNMMSSAQEYNKYAEEVLGPKLDPEVFKQIKEFEKNKDYHNPKYMELLMNHYYTEHIVNMPIDQWPESINRAFKHLNPEVYIYMQGPSEFGITGDATLKDWDVREKLKTITVPTLVVGAKNDTMDPKHMEWMSKQVKNGSFVLCNGGHCAQYDDPNNFFPGVIQFLKDVDQGKIKQ